MEFMQEAYRLAKKGSYTTYPNPMVGAVIVHEKKIIGRGYHESYGGNHAERNAFIDAYKNGYGCLLKDSILYVTLEPCNHSGKTPPCIDLIIKEKIKEVHVSQLDVNPLMQGKSIEILKKHAIKVVLGEMKEYGEVLNRKFNKQFTNGLPYITIKTATSLDGKIATKDYDSKWITCEESRKRVHLLRKHNDSIMTSYKTANIDNAKLNVRFIKSDHNPVPIIIDRKLKLKGELDLFDIHKKVFIVTSEMNKKNRIKFKSIESKAEIVYIYTKEVDGKLDLKTALEEIKLHGINSVLIEAGSYIAWEMLSNNLIDEFYMFIAPKIIGGKDALSVVTGEGFKKVSDSLILEFDDAEFLGRDILIRGRRKCLQE